jgi:hypothetical protein
MQFKSVVFTSILAALAAAEPVVNPVTVTSLSPEQVRSISGSRNR